MQRKLSTGVSGMRPIRFVGCNNAGRGSIPKSGPRSEHPHGQKLCYDLKTAQMTDRYYIGWNSKGEPRFYGSWKSARKGVGPDGVFMMELDAERAVNLSRRKKPPTKAEAIDHNRRMTDAYYKKERRQTESRGAMTRWNHGHR